MNFAAENILDSPLYHQLVKFRRDMHQHPELSWREHRTGDKICQFLDRIGVAYRRGPFRGWAKTGIIADIPGAAKDRSVAMRADLDALPVIEETGLSFASKTHGVMHACGHDGHCAMLLGAASLLAKEPRLPAPVRLIFQPAEETGQGAKGMIEAGALEKVGVIFGGHVDRHFPVGSVVVTSGVVNASSDRFSIRITGKGGHAARPHETVDAVVVGSLMVMALQTIVSREINPAHPSVVTVGRFDAGTASNVIAGQAHLEGSIRAQDHEVRQYLHRSIERIATSIAQLHGASIEIEITQGTPELVNPLQCTKVARRAAALVVGQDNVLKMKTANMGGEDFSYYLEKVSGCYVRFGTAREGVEQYAAHSSKFDIDEQAIAVGAAYYLAVAKLAGEEISSQPSAISYQAERLMQKADG